MRAPAKLNLRALRPFRVKTASPAPLPIREPCGVKRRKTNLDEAALALGFTRMKEGELRGDITALLNQIAEALPSKSPDDIRRFLMERD